MEQIIQEFLEYLKNNEKVSGNTYDSYSRDISSFNDFLNKIEVNDLKYITENTVLLYKVSLEDKERSASTIARHLATLRKFFDYLRMNRMIANNPMDDISSPRIKKKTFDILSMDEVNQILAGPTSKSRFGRRDLVLLYLVYYTDIRVAEFVNLNLDDFNAQIGYLRCKNNRDQDRIVPLPKEALDILLMYINEIRPSLAFEGEPAMFINSSGFRMSRQGVWKTIRKYADKANIDKKITFNLLRHSFLIHKLQNGGEIDNMDKVLEIVKNNPDVLKG